MGTRFHFNRVRVVWIVHLQRSKHHTAKKASWFASLIPFYMKHWIIWVHSYCDDMCHEELSHCLMQLQQSIIFRLVQFSALPPKIVSAPVVLFQSTWDSWSYHQPNSHNYQRHFPHDFNQETPAKVDSSRARAIVVVPLRFPHRQNLCNRPPSASEDSTTLHLTNCVSQ